MSGTFIRDIIVLEFVPGTSRRVRQRTVEGVRARVVGGVRFEEGSEGLYYLRLSAGSSERDLFTALRSLRALPQVAGAEVEMIGAAGAATELPDESR